MGCLMLANAIVKLTGDRFEMGLDQRTKCGQRLGILLRPLIDEHLAGRAELLLVFFWYLSAFTKCSYPF